MIKLTRYEKKIKDKLANMYGDEMVNTALSGTGEKIKLTGRGYPLHLIQFVQYLNFKNGNPQNRKTAQTALNNVIRALKYIDKEKTKRAKAANKNVQKELVKKAKKMKKIKIETVKEDFKDRVKFYLGR